MSLIGISLNLLLAVLLLAALAMGWRLNKRLKALRDSHDGFAVAVRELNAAAERAEQGLADLRAATDEASELLGDRLEKGRALASRLDRLLSATPANLPEPAPEGDGVDRRLGALIAAAREARTRPPAPRQPLAARPMALPDDDLFEEPLSLGGRP